MNRVFEKDQKTNAQIWHAGRVRNQVIDDQEMIFLTEFAASCGLTVAKVAFKKAGAYKEGMTVSEDLELIFRMVASGCDYHAIPVPLIQVNIHPSASLSRTSTLLKHIQNTEYLIDNNLALMSSLPLVWLHYHTVLLANYYRAGQVANAHRLIKKILKMRFFYTPAWERIFRFELKRVRRFFSNRDKESRC